MPNRQKVHTMAVVPRRTLKDVLKLTRAGRLGDATTLLRDSLGFDARRPAPDAARGERAEHPSWTNATWTSAPTAGRSQAGRFEAGRPKGHPAETAAPDPSARAAPRERAVSAEPGSFTEHSVRNAHGARRYKLYLPGRAAASPLPLVVMLHGCTQSPDDFAAGTRMNAIADELGFVVAYPEQSRAANASKCWNWFKPGDQRRDAGEPSLIADMVGQIGREVGPHFALDPRRVFVAGLSAGGAAAAVLAQTHPDLFAGVGVHSGLACGAAHDLSAALSAMRAGAPAASGPVAAPGRAPPTIVFHGTADRTVHPANAGHVVERAVAGLDAPKLTRGCSPGGVAFAREVYRRGRQVVAEVWTLEGVGHAWSGGSPAGSYTEPRGPDASREMMRFFLALKG